MNYLISVLLVLVLVAACSEPKRLTPEPLAPLEQRNVEAVEKVTRPAQNFTPEPTPEEHKVPLSPLENTENVPDPYSSIGCEQLLTAEQFASACQKMADTFVVTSQIGTRNCFVNIRDRDNERRTAGLTLTGFSDAQAAKKEFERRAHVLGRNLSTSAGEQSYQFTKVDRETLTFLRSNYIVEVGVDKQLCNEDELPVLAQSIDKHIS
ncbi:hypothetical protein J4211_03005 [Candidatus Woesearchaeota archaeon]|nr:hypothetical protein [Candidatus Woesearchaeota archaeon]